MSSIADRNLLVGVLALQFDFINRETLVAATTAWIHEKSKMLEDVLLEGQHIQAAERDSLKSLVDTFLTRHDNDSTEGLRALLSVDEVRQVLDTIPDQDVTKSISTITMESLEPVGRLSSAGKRYVPLQKYKAGGLGEIWKSQDTELNRIVAVKNIKQGAYADDPAAHARLSLEAEITGGLEHPGIVPVHGFDYGADGRPFYAMRFLYGSDLREVLKEFHKTERDLFRSGEGSLGLRQMLGRLIDVCNAIEYAHGRGVLHRDLKPPNIIVGEHGETYVADWGLSSAGGDIKTWSSRSGTHCPTRQGPLQPRLSQAVTVRSTGSCFGTPGYASPEQTRGELEALSPATDVYSLGVVLYEVLTGKHPFYERGADNSLRTLERKVCHGEFRRPRERNPKIPKALEAICLKAMALDAEDRYPTPLALATDLERWLADEPVSAWSEPLAVRARRWVKRHRTLAASTAASLLVALLALTTGLVVVSRAWAETERQRNQAEVNFNLARSAVDDLFVSVSETTLLERPALQRLRGELLEKARQYYLQFIAQKPASQQLQDELARAYFGIGRVEEDLGNRQQALQWYEKAAEIQSQLVAAANPGQQPDERDYDRVLTLNAMGRVMHDSRRLPEALNFYTQAHQVRRALAESQPDNLEFQRVAANSQMNIGLVHKDEGDLAEAARWQAEAQQQRRNQLPTAPDNDPALIALQRDLGKGDYNLAVLARQRGEREKAIQRVEAARDQFQQLVDDRYGIDDDLYYLARSHHLLGQIRGNSSQPEELQQSLRAYQQAYQQAKELNRVAADVPRYEHLLGQIGNDLGLGFAQDPKRSGFFYQEAVALLRKASAADLDNDNLQVDLATALMGSGKTRLATGDNERGMAELRESLELFRVLQARREDASAFETQIQAAGAMLEGA